VGDAIIAVSFAVFLDNVIGRPNEPISWFKVLLETRL